MSDVLGLPTSTILAWARAGLLAPQRDQRGGYVFSFQDIAVLRAARELLDADVSARRVKQTLESLRDQLPPGRPLSAVHLSARGGRVFVKEESRTWEPDTGQLEMTLEPGSGAVVGRPAGPPAERAPWPQPSPPGDAEAWFDAALDLEGADEAGARAAYEHALLDDPDHADAHLNLGRILHEDGGLDGAEEHYRAALAADPGSARAAYNLGVVLEDQGRADEAVAAYQRALDKDPDLAVAHFNLSRLHEVAGRRADALGHLASYKRILDRSGPLPT